MSPLQDASTCSEMSCSTHSAKGHVNGMVLVAGGSKVSIFEGSKMAGPQLFVPLPDGGCGTTGVLLPYELSSELPVYSSRLS